MIGRADESGSPVPVLASRPALTFPCFCTELASSGVCIRLGIAGPSREPSSAASSSAALATIVNNATELRNAGFGTAHGVSQRRALDVATARLVVASTVAAATFYLEAYAADQGS